MKSSIFKSLKSVFDPTKDIELPSGYSEYSAKIEYLFTVLPISITTIILLFQGKFSQILFGAEWSFMSAVLAGQIIVKSMKATEGHNSMIDTLKWIEDSLKLPKDERIIVPEWEELNPIDHTTWLVVRTIIFILCPALALVGLTLTSAVTSLLASWLLGLAHWFLFIYTSYKFFRVSTALDIAEFSEKSHKKFLLKHVKEFAKVAVIEPQLSDQEQTEGIETGI